MPVSPENYQLGKCKKCAKSFEYFYINSEGIRKTLSRNRNECVECKPVREIKDKKIKCTKCSNLFDENIIINGLRFRLRGRTKCLLCNPYSGDLNTLKEVVRVNRSEIQFKTCVNCDKQFTNYVIVNGISKKTGIDRRQRCYDCSPFRELFSENLSIEWEIIENNIVYRKCSHCQIFKELNKNNFLLKNKRNCICRECNKKDKRSIIKERKSKIVEYKGGKCCICGYDNCYAALDLHHIDPKLKDHDMSKKLMHLNFEDIVEELDKCILLCSNCHRELHAGMHPEIFKKDFS